MNLEQKIQIKMYSKMIIVSAINNWAFSFNIPLTLHIVFRAGSLVTNLLMSKLILKRNFSTEKYISVATITTGKDTMFRPEIA